MADHNTDGYQCYFCHVESSADNILSHTILHHDQADSKFSIRQRQLDDKLGTIVYRSIHFPWMISTLKNYKKQGVILKINTDQRKIQFKRRHTGNEVYESETRQDKNNPTTHDASTQTTLIDTEIWQLLLDVLSILKEADRYEDFLSVLKCISDKTIINNIALHLLLDVGNFYSKDSIQSLRYNDETIAFWVTVKKLFKGKGINFFRGFKAQALSKAGNGLISPKDCRINFVVPSNPILAAESAKYTVGVANPGILSTSLDAFAENNESKDVKISIDGKKLALGIGKNGDENLCGLENSPTLKERQERLADEINTAKTIKSCFERNDLVNIKDNADSRTKDTARQGLIITISNMSKRVRELREFNVKRKRHIDHLIKCVDGSWQQSKFAHAISYWQTKLLQANNCILDLIDSIDKLGYVISCLNGTSQNYILGNKSTIFLNEQENYKCLRDMADLNPFLYQHDSNIIKQRSETWLNLRNESRITGSTIFKALGLDTLKEQQKHHDKVYYGIEQPVSENLASLFQYGTTQEINALGSLVGKLMPVYFPQLFFKEDGCIILPFGDTKAVISGDGTGVNRETSRKEIAFEFKCPMPGKKFTTYVFYEIPVYYTTQVLAQMAAKNVQQMAFICYTPESITFIRGDFDTELWSRLWKLTEKYYGKADAFRPKKRDPEVQSLVADLKEYSRKCEFIAEFPTLRSVPCSCSPTNDVSDIFGDHVSSMAPDVLLMSDVPMLIQNSITATETSYNILRKPAKEVLVTVISDLDRQSRGDDSVVHAVPIHYALSGFSLPMISVRNILNQIVQSVEQRNLNTKAIAFDGQFMEIAIADESGKALTVSKFTKQFWEYVKSTDKKVKQDVLINLNEMPKMTDIDDVVRFFDVKRNSTGFTVSVKNSFKMKIVGSPGNISKVLTKKKEKETEIEKDDAEETQTFKDSDILQYLPSEIIAELDDEAIQILKNIGKSDLNTTHPTETELDNITNQDDKFETALIALLVHDENKSKFVSYSLDDFKQLFKDAKTINSTFTVKELKTLVDLLDRTKHNKTSLKSELVNSVSEFYGNGDRVMEPLKSPMDLKTLTRRHIKTWTIDAVNVAYAQLNFQESFDAWCESNPFKGSWNIITEKGIILNIPQWYAQPSVIHGKLVQPIIDPHHIFVNNRSRCCSKGMSGMGINPNSWWKVAEDSKNNDTGLSIEVAKELRDRQSNSFAQLTFSEKVEKVMEKNGYFIEANWCSLIRNWYHAIDDAGIAIDDRIQMMLKIRSYLLTFLKAGHFPPHGSYVAGLPIAQYEGILTNVDRRIQLYHMTRNGTYNQRAVTSLDSETFFSGFQDYDPKGSGVLRVDDIPIALGAAVDLYKQRLDSKRKFFMRTSERVRVYSVRELENDSISIPHFIPGDNPLPQTIYLRSHQFDLGTRKTKLPKRKSGLISDKSARGAEGARSFHKFNEEKILPHRRSGIADDELFETQNC